MAEQIRKIVQLKDAEYGEKGAVKAVFATFGVIDHDGDMMLSGSIGEQKVRMSAYGHRSWYGELPVGKGRIYESGKDAIFEGQFFLTTNAGRETYETVKAMGDLQEWSFALPEVESETRTDNGQAYRAIKKVRVPEVSPVLLGAGVDTRTLDVKGEAQKPKDMKLIDHVEWLLAQTTEVAERLKSVAEMREEQNRHPSRETLKRSAAVAVALQEVARVIDDVRAKHDVLTREFLRFQEMTATGRR